MARAITLVELILAVVLMSMVTLSVGGVYATAVAFFTAFNAQADMQNQANIALQDMIKNIYLAEDVERISSSEIEVIPAAGPPFRYKQESSDITRDSEVIARGVERLEFSPLTINPGTQRKTLQIDLTMSGRVGLAELNFVTKVTLRKYE